MCRTTVSARVALMLFFCSTQVLAQPAGYKAANDEAAFRKQFATQSAKIATLSSNFTQEKTLTALTEKISSSGSFKFKRENKVRLQYLKPFRYLLIMNGDKMKVKDDQKETQVNVRSSKLFQQINRIIIDCVQGTILGSKDFTNRIFENEKLYLLEMKPSSKSLREFFSTIIVKIEKGDYSVHSIEMNEPSDDKTIIIFTDKKINEPIPDEVFAF